MKSRRRRFDITPEQSRAARAFVGLTQPELGRLSNLGIATIVRLERGAGDLHYTTPGRVEAALRRKGITLINDETSSGVRLEREAPSDPQALREEVITPGQCRAARALLGLSRKELANLVGVNKAKIEAVEGLGAKADEPTLRRVRATLVVRGIVFGNEPSALSVQLRHFA